LAPKLGRVQPETLVKDAVTTPPTGPRRRWWRTPGAFRFTALAVLVGILAVIMVTVHPDRHAIANALGTKNAFAPAIAVVGTALLTAALVPRTLLSAVGGLLFGWFPGAGYILVGVTLGAIVAHTIGRLLGREFMARHLRGRLLQVEQAVADRGLVAVAVTRMVPFIPFCIANYVFGTTSVRFVPFVLGTLLGALPATLAYSALGSATAQHNTTGMTVAATVVATLGIGGSVGTLLIWRRRPRKTAAPTIV
jgi:uncharacterized membrane protein YdjX (TVP38/TMEM64 family)